jgi:hypothetical protein
LELLMPSPIPALAGFVCSMAAMIAAASAALAFAPSLVVAGTVGGGAYLVVAAFEAAR